MVQEAVDSLREAVQAGRADVVRSILSHCEKETDENGECILKQILGDTSHAVGTVLHQATKLENPDCLRALLAAGADPCVQNSEGLTPVDLAVSDQIKDVYNQEMLQCTAQSNVGRVCQLLAAGVHINFHDSPSSQNTPLHWAATYANQDMVQCLCDRGANVNAVNNCGHTPLHDAVKRMNIEIIEELILNDADPNVKATSGKDAGLSAFDMAAGQPVILKSLTKPSSKLGVDGQSDVNGPSVEQDSEEKIKRLASTASMESEGGTGCNGVVNKLADTLEGSSISPPLISDHRFNLLWPLPQRVTIHSGPSFRPSQTIVVKVINGPEGLTSEACAAWSIKHYNIQRLGYRLTIQSSSTTFGIQDTGGILCQVNSRLFKTRESYQMFVYSNQVKILASDIAGLNYAIATFAQLLHLCHLEGIPQLQISDWPNLSSRGVLLDVSQGRIPKQEALKDLVDTLCMMKINQVHLYTRFKVHEENPRLWQLCYSKSELLELAYFCRQRSVLLIPVLDIAPGLSYDDIGSLYHTFHDVISCFHDSNVINIGPRLSTFILDTSEENYLDAADANRLIPFSAHHSLQLCAYVFHDDSSSVVRQLPLNMSVMEYGFQADYDFEKYCKSYAENGVPFQVCPGTAAWNSLAGCPEAAVTNIHKAVQCTLKYDGQGMVVCDWSGKGHMTHKTFSWPGYISCAGLAWNSATTYDHVQGNLPELINKHVLNDFGSVTGQVLIELGRAETYVLKFAKQKANDSKSLPDDHGSVLYQLLTHPDSASLEYLTPDVFQKARRHIKKCQSELSKSSLQCLHGMHMLSELKLTCDLMLCACRVGRALMNTGKNPGTMAAAHPVVNLGVNNLPATIKTDLANRLLGLIDQYRTMWLTINQPQGLQESLVTLSNMLKQFLPSDLSTE